MDSIKFPNYQLNDQQINDNVTSKQSLHNSLKFVLVTAQTFAQFPLDGVRKSDTKDLQFKWKSFKMFYTLLFASCVFVVVAIDLCQMLKHGTDIFIISKCEILKVVIFFQLQSILKKLKDINEFPKGFFMVI